MSGRTRGEQDAAPRPVKPGLVVVVVEDAALLFHARRVLERQALSGGSKVGLPMPAAKPVRSLYTGTVRGFEETQLVYRYGVPEDAPTYTFKHLGRAGFEYCCEEGLSVLLPIIGDSAETWISAAQAARVPVEAQMAEVLAQIRTAAIAADAYVLLFLVTRDGAGATEFERVADECVLVQRCEAEPGAVLSFCTHWTGFSHLPGVGVNSARMFSVFVRDHQFKCKVEDFVVRELSTRVMWKLRCTELSLSRIAEIFGIDKSTVKRRLDPLAPPRSLSLSRDWLQRYLDALDIALPAPASAAVPKPTKGKRG